MVLPQRLRLKRIIERFEAQQRAEQGLEPHLRSPTLKGDLKCLRYALRLMPYTKSEAERRRKKTLETLKGKWAGMEMRDNSIKELRKNGEKLAYIASLHNISVTRVHEICGG
jgi:hypothetical protein